MWIQTMAVNPSLAVGKGTHGSQGSSGPSAAKGVDFAAWLQASLSGIDEPAAGASSSASVERPTTPILQGEWSEDVLTNLLQEWLAAALQPLLPKGAENPSGMQETAHLDARPTTDPAVTIQPTGLDIGHLPDWLKDVPPESVQQWVSLLETVPDILQTDGMPMSDFLRLNGSPGQWLQAVLQSAEHLSDASLQASHPLSLRWIRTAMPPSDGHGLANVDMPAGEGHHFPMLAGALRLEGGDGGKDPFAAVSGRELLSQMWMRSGAGQDGTAGGAPQDHPGMATPSPNGFHLQGAAGTERSFIQWLSQAGAPEPAEGNPSLPTREVSPLYPTVRLILSRFETLDGRGYEARFQLYPEQLGTVHVKLVLHQGALQAQLVVDTRMAKDALESQLQSLQQAFAQQGLQVDKIHVTVREDALFQWHDQNAFLYQEQRQHARQDAQGGHAPGSSGGYVTEEVEEGQGQTGSVRAALVSSKEGIDLSI